ncbi:hypothetical protein [Saccharolobus caldissimus]|uniref:Uncharacterized protein n=1 Tax=Saccharolobus caldissimus TaxID=1702097 RepID=A0AAQ4CRC7_9CREN|nr:hypothetical protein [Saccharolobus caldissimus]BDB98358.1 hypothetical protein SACC_13750 [Saccharolobus caldissimus]
MERKSKFINTKIEVICNKCKMPGRLAIRLRQNIGIECYIYHGKWPLVSKHSVSCNDYKDIVDKFIKR